MSTVSYRFGEFLVDLPSLRLLRGGAAVEIEPKALLVLVHLVEHPRRLVTKQELLDAVWAYRGPSKTRTLDSHASRLRRKLDPEGGRFVVNCWGIGYRLIDG